MTPQDPAFYMLHDEAAMTVATAAPRRIPGQGRADIGGRMRVARILQSIGAHSSDIPVRIAGSTNEVWRAGEYVIRVGFQAGAHRLRREAVLATYFDSAVKYPEVVATGVEAFGEWIVVRRLPGIPLSEAWATMSLDGRRSCVKELAGALRRVHQTDVSGERSAIFALSEVESEAMPHQLPVERLLELLEQARYMHGMDRAFIDDVTARVHAVSASLPAHERVGLVHGDLHFENVLVDQERISAVLDFEWARRGPIEIDIDVLARFCHDPTMHIGGSYPIKAADFRDVLRWIHDEYPELFATPDIRNRLFLCALAFDVPWLLRISVSGPVSSLPQWHPVNQIRDLLQLGSHAERLGWV